MKATKKLIVIGDRVLIELDESRERTTTGLYLPPTVKEKEKVHGGYIVKVGPGYPVSDPNTVVEEYIPLQATEGDYAIFLKDAAIEIEFEGKKYHIVPHSAILALVRTEFAEE
jgi:co-chaperonin GroES (HSP10)